MRGKRVLSFVTAFLVLCLLAAGCAPKATPAPTPQPTVVPKPTAVPPTPVPTPKPRGTLKYSIYWEPPIRNPIYESVSGDMAWYFDPLIRVEYDGSILPRLAEKWEHDTSGKEWTFYLRKNVVWHDGQPFNADDVVFTFSKVEDEKIASPMLGNLQVSGQNIQVQKVDDYTVKFILPEPYGPFLTNLAYVGVAPKHLLENSANMETDDFNKKPIGTGPFMVTEIVDGDHWTLVANDNFYLGKPGLAGVSIRVSGDTQAVVAALKTGELDIAESEEITDLDWFTQKGGYTIYTCTPGGITYLFLNIIKDPLFHDVQVRKALMYAIDRQGIVDAVTFGKALVADSPIIDKGFSAWASNPDVTRYAYDPAKAKELLAAEGWKAGAGGTLEKDGKPFQFTAIVQSGYATYENTMSAIQANLKTVGIDMQIQTLERSAFRALRSDKERADKMQAFLSGAGIPEDPDQMYGVFHSSNYPGGANYFGYSNARVDELLAKGRVTVDRDARKPLYMEAQKIISDEVPYIPTYYYWIGWVVNSRVKGLPAPDKLGGVDPTYYIGWFAERLSIE